MSFEIYPVAAKVMDNECQGANLLQVAGEDLFDLNVDVGCICVCAAEAKA